MYKSKPQSNYVYQLRITYNINYQLTEPQFTLDFLRGKKSQFVQNGFSGVSLHKAVKWSLREKAVTSSGQMLESG